MSRQVHRIHLRNRILGRRFDDVASFRDAWGELEEEITEKLNEDYDVVIDE